MLDGYLKELKVIKRLRTGMFGPFLESYIEEVVGAGYRPATIRGQLYVLDGFQSWMQAKGLVATDLNLAVVDKFVQGRRRSRKRRSVARPTRGEKAALQLLLQQLEAMGLISLHPPPMETAATEQLVGRFRAFLKRERGVASATAQKYG